MSDSIRVLVADDHMKVHRAMAALLGTTDDLQLIGYASNGQEAVTLCDELQPDVVLMDVLMPIMDGIEATHLILHKHPEIKIIALSSFVDDDNVRSMLKAGAIGFLLKNAPIHDLPQTIRTVVSGISVISSELTRLLLSSAHAEEAVNTSNLYNLTARELEVLRLMVKGLNNSEIAKALTVSLSTIKFHVSSIIAKLQVANRIEATALAVEKKLLSS